MEDEKDDFTPEKDISLADISHETIRRLSYGKEATIRGIDKAKYKIEFENENESSVDIVIREK